MIIKLIPETDEERTRFIENFQSAELVHSGIKEFFIFGNKLLADSQLIDFHEWSGNPRYLMGNLSYFYEVVNDERRAKDRSSQKPKQQPQQPQQIRFPQNTVGDVQERLPQPKIVMENREPRIVKKGEIAANIKTIDVENLKKHADPSPTNGPRIIQMSELRKTNININPISVEAVPNIPIVDGMIDEEEDGMPAPEKDLETN